MLLRRLGTHPHGLRSLPIILRPFSTSQPSHIRYKGEPPPRVLPRRIVRLRSPSGATTEKVATPTDIAGAIVKATNAIENGHYHFAERIIQQKLIAAITHDHRLDDDELAYKKLAEDALELFLDRDCLEGINMVTKTLDSLGRDFLLPLPLRAKLLTCRFANGMMHPHMYMNNLKAIFQQWKFTRISTSEDFVGILKQLTCANGSLAMMEKVTALYMKHQKALNSEFRLDGNSLAFLIARNLDRGIRPRAQYWLKQAEHLVGQPNSAVCLPYKVFLHYILRNLPSSQDPEEYYRLFLKRMVEKGAMPDTELLNMLLKFELEHGRFDRVFRMYDDLRSHQPALPPPDETTSKLVFDTHTEIYKQGIYSRVRNATSQAQCAPNLPRDSDPDTVPNTHASPRQVFWDMINTADPNADPSIKPETHAITPTTMSSALAYFVFTADYAAAIVVLRMYVRLELGFREAHIKLVLDSLVERCRLELLELPGLNAKTKTIGNTSVEWVDVFLNLRETTRRRILRESTAEMTRRIVNVAKRALALAELDIHKSDATESEEPSTAETSEPSQGARDDADVTREDSDVQGAPSETEIRTSDPGNGQTASSEKSDGILDDSAETNNASRKEDPLSSPSPSTTEQQSTTNTLRQEKLKRMRMRRIEYVDVLLSRALAAECFLDGVEDPSEAGSIAVNQAVEEMVPKLKVPGSQASDKCMSLKLGDGFNANSIYSQASQQTPSSNTATVQNE